MWQSFKAIRLAGCLVAKWLASRLHCKCCRSHTQLPRTSSVSFSAKSGMKIVKASKTWIRNCFATAPPSELSKSCAFKSEHRIFNSCSTGRSWPHQVKDGNWFSKSVQLNFSKLFRYLESCTPQALAPKRRRSRMAEVRFCSTASKRCCRSLFWALGSARNFSSNSITCSPSDANRNPLFTSSNMFGYAWFTSIFFQKELTSSIWCTIAQVQQANVWKPSCSKHIEKVGFLSPTAWIISEKCHNIFHNSKTICVFRNHQESLRSQVVNVIIKHPFLPVPRHEHLMPWPRELALPAEASRQCHALQRWGRPAAPASSSHLGLGRLGLQRSARIGW